MRSMSPSNILIIILIIAFEGIVEDNSDTSMIFEFQGTVEDKSLHFFQ